MTRPRRLKDNMAKRSDSPSRASPKGNQGTALQSPTYGIAVADSNTTGRTQAFSSGASQTDVDAERVAVLMQAALQRVPSTTLPAMGGTKTLPENLSFVSKVADPSEELLPEGVTVEDGEEMERDVDRIRIYLRAPFFHKNERADVLMTFAKWRMQDADYCARHRVSAAPFLDAFVTKLRIRAVGEGKESRAVLDALFHAFGEGDDTMPGRDEAFVGAVKSFISQSRHSLDYRVAKRERGVLRRTAEQVGIGALATAKGLSTGLAGMVGGRAVAEDVGRNFDYLGSQIYDEEWRNGERLFLGLAAKDLGELGGDIAWTLTTRGKGSAIDSIRQLGQTFSRLHSLQSVALGIRDLVVLFRELDSQGKLSEATLLENDEYRRILLNLLGDLYSLVSNNSRRAERIRFLLASAETAVLAHRLVVAYQAKGESEMMEREFGLALVDFSKQVLAMIIVGRDYHGGRAKPQGGSPKSDSSAPPVSKSPDEVPSAQPKDESKRPPAESSITPRPALGVATNPALAPSEKNGAHVDATPRSKGALASAPDGGGGLEDSMDSAAFVGARPGTTFRPAPMRDSSSRERQRYRQAAFAIYDETRRGAPNASPEARASALSREVALAHNPKTGEFVVVQGYANSVHVPDGFVPIAHSHPKGKANWLPSPADLVIIQEGSESSGGKLLSRIDIDAPNAPSHAWFGYDKSKTLPFVLRTVDPDSGQLVERGFRDPDEYCRFVYDETGVDPRPSFARWRVETGRQKTSTPSSPPGVSETNGNVAAATKMQGLKDDRVKPQHEGEPRVTKPTDETSPKWGMPAEDGEIPPTGVGRFDELMVGTKRFDNWVAALEKKGFTIEIARLRPGDAAEVDWKVVRVSPDRFRYLDMLHESRHVGQVLRAEKRGVMSGNGHIRALFEKGAYEYELRVGAAKRFSPEYMSWAQGQIAKYWQPSSKKKYLFDPTMRRLWF